MTSVPAVYMRGGTSKGVFLHTRDIPPFGPELDDLLLRIMGSPDPMQIDGMGGTHSSTSKAVVVERRGAEIAYRFAQVSIDRAQVDWSGNCGNLTTAVAPFAIDEGLVDVVGESAVVFLRNDNTGVRIEATVQLSGGKAATTGDHAIAGVPGTGSPVTTRYLDPAGSVLGSLLPTGGPVVELDVGGDRVEASIVDAAHPYVFVRAADVGLTGELRSAPDRNSDAELLSRIEAIRGAAAVLVGAASSAAEAQLTSPAVPRIVAVAPGQGEAHVSAVAFSMGRVHRALPMTAALCIGAAVHTEGTIVADAASYVGAEVVIAHPRGPAPVLVEYEGGVLRSVGVVRTARRVMDGRVHPSPR